MAKIEIRFAADCCVQGKTKKKGRLAIHRPIAGKGFALTDIEDPSLRLLFWAPKKAEVVAARNVLEKIDPAGWEAEIAKLRGF